MLRKLILVCLTAFALSACAPQGMYVWGDYEGRLYSYYENPEKIEQLMQALDSTIVNAEEFKRVPPGIYAEYGYLLLVSNRDDEAKAYFQKEKDAWPESVVLMDKMIVLAESKMSQTESSEESESAGETE